MRGECGAPPSSASGARARITLVAVVIAVISDTHLPRGRRRLPDACVERIRDADLVVHAGDFTAPEVHDEIAAIGPPVRAVHGNVDAATLKLRLPETDAFDAGGATVALIHDAGPSKRRLERMRARFPDAAAVIFGHSHIPLHEEADGFQIFNPGSPTDRRRQPEHTMGMAEASGGRVTFRHVALG